MEGGADTLRKPKSHSFFKVLIGDYATKLRIPVLFVNRFRSVLPKKVALRVSSNKSWRVDIEEESDKKLHFKTGWETFVKDIGLENGDFIVFKYDGNSTFKVKIYGISACEKEVRMGINQNSDVTAGKQNQKEITLMPEENLKERNPIAENRSKWKKAGEGHVTQIKKEKEDSDCYINQVEGSKGEGVSKRTTDKEAEEESNEVMDIEPEVLLGKIGMFKRTIQQKRTTTSTEVNEDRKLDPKNPSFRILMRVAYAERGVMSIPTDFFKQHMINKRQHVEIQSLKGSWTVRCIPHKKGNYTYARFSAGWASCARDNHFKAGETLIFTLIQRNRAKFIVHKVK